MIIDSIIESKLSAKGIELTKFGSYNAVIPEVEGIANMTGKNTFYINPEDEFKNGFILR
jgi:trans-L-3-hydroxyproline dehydratase